MAQRIRRVASEKELEQVVDDFITQGYKVVSRGQLSTNLKKKKKASGSGHVIVFLLTFWFTLGVGNLIYHFVQPTEDDVLVRLQKEA